MVKGSHGDAGQHVYSFCLVDYGLFGTRGTIIFSIMWSRILLMRLRCRCWHENEVWRGWKLCRAYTTNGLESPIIVLIVSYFLEPHCCCHGFPLPSFLLQLRLVHDVTLSGPFGCWRVCSWSRGDCWCLVLSELVFWVPSFSVLLTVF
jgi:hypothetical protein